MTRRFEFIGGNSAKFWEITQQGNTVSVCYGRLGAAGQQQNMNFQDRPSARKYAEKLIAQKLAKGYVECAAV